MKVLDTQILSETILFYFWVKCPYPGVSKWEILILESRMVSKRKDSSSPTLVETETQKDIKARCHKLSV